MYKDYGIMVDHTESSVVPTERIDSPDPLVPKGVITNRYRTENPNAGIYNISIERDYTMQVFRTCSDPLYLLHPSGVTTPIMYNGLHGCTPVNDYVNNTNIEGVYVVESYSLAGVTNSNTDEFLTYYTKTKGLAYTDEVIKDIKQVIQKERINNKGVIHTVLRIVTFVTACDIIDNQYTYVSGPGCVISCGVPPHDLLHPFSPNYIKNELISRNDSRGSATIDITIIDNDKKPYYYMLANKVQTIRPIDNKCSSVLPKGGSITIRRGDDLIKEYSFPLEELETYGFYKNREMCVANGDVKLATEERKQHVEIEKLKLELQKVEESKKKLQIEAENRERQHEIDKAKDKLDMDKKISDLDFHKAAKDIDIIHTGAKVKLDLLSKKVDFNYSLVKHSLDIDKYVMEMDKLMYVNNLKIADTASKTLGNILKTII